MMRGRLKFHQYQRQRRELIKSGRMQIIEAAEAYIQVMKEENAI